MGHGINVTRIWEIDFFRGIAIILMVLFHLLYDLAVFFNFSIKYETGLIYYMGKMAASLFIIVAGISCSFSTNNAKRGIKLIVLGMLVYLVTFVFVPGSNIIFGILQFLGLSMLLYSLINKLSSYLLFIFGTTVIILNYSISAISMKNNWLAPIGLLGPQFSSVDYYPIIPWFGLFIYGVVFSKLFYREKRSLFKFDLRNNLLSSLGRHSLLIYLLHQPIILFIIFMIYKLTKIL